MKAVDFYINALLPEELRDYNRQFTKKELSKVLSELATKYPDKYSETVKKIADIGRREAYWRGETINLNDLKPVFDKKSVIHDMKLKLKVINKIPDKVKRKEARLQLFADTAQDLHKRTISGAISKKTNLGNFILSGARGNPIQLRAMITTPALYADYADNPIDLFIEKSFSEGLRPAEYLASAFGTRKGVISTKNSTQDTGYLTKQMGVALADLIVTEDDSGDAYGMKVATDDINDVRGRYLAKDVGPFKAGSLIDKEAAAYIKSHKIPAVYIKSPITSRTADGLDAKSIGIMPNKQHAAIGLAVGSLAHTSLGEPLAQAGLNQKHSAGATSGKAKLNLSGFDVINQFMQAPKSFPHRAAVAEIDGNVEKIEKAPQGGHYIYVNGERHYSSVGLDPMVKVGDSVEAGEAISDGLVDPKDVVRLRGIGEGRKYYADRLKKIYEDTGIPIAKLNLEILARGAVNHIELEDNTDYPDLIPDEPIRYNTFARRYKPRADAANVKLKDAKGKYLEAPMLHYTIGTRLTPKMIGEIKEFGANEVYVSPTPPVFKPSMVRLMTVAEANPDWLARMHSTLLKRQLEDGAVRGDDSNIKENIHFAPRIAVGENFGDKLTTTGKY